MKKFVPATVRFIFSFCLGSISVAVSARTSAESILILQSGAEKNEYVAEMLKAEGFHSFGYLDTESNLFTPQNLASADVVILPRIMLTEPALSVLLDYVRNGGRLIVFRPQPSLASGLGYGPPGNVIKDGYLAITENAVTGKGLLKASLQFHGEADVFRPADDRIPRMVIIARLADHNKAGLPTAAVSFSHQGKGQAILFFYDPVRSTLLTRQGNEALAAMETDSINGIRAMDMFTGGWVDTANNTLNQADEQLRLLSRCIETLTANRKPVPRCWYFPDSLKSLVALTNDGEFRSAADFSEQFADVAAQQARMTLYVLTPEKIDVRFTDSALKNGFEIAAHPDATAEAGDPTWAGVSNAIQKKLLAMQNFPGVAPIRTNTNHWFVWCGKDSAGRRDFSAGAQIEARFGIRIDVNYAHYDNKAGVARFLGPTGYRQGNFTGSGLPMKFGTAQGKTIDVYQLFNNVYDQEYMENQDQDGYDSAFRGLLDRSLNNEIYSYICIRAHNDEYFFSRAPLMRILGLCREKKIPVWPVNRVLEFLTARDSLSFDNLNWNKNRLSFQLSATLFCRDRPAILLPAEFSGHVIAAVRVAQVAVPYSVQVIRGKRYALFSVDTGRTVPVEADYK